MRKPTTQTRGVRLVLFLALLGGCGDDTATPDRSAQGTAADQESATAVLNIYNWSDYIAPDTIADFERETGIKVNYDVFDTNEVLEAKLLAGHSGYDIVVPSADFVARQVQAGLLQPIDRARLSGFDNLDPMLLDLMQTYDPGNRHAVPYMWGTTGIGYNRQRIAERFSGAAPLSWDLLLDAASAARIADCGIALVDAPAEVFPTVLHYLGLPPNSRDPAHLAQAEALLHGVRPSIRYFHSSQYINDLANGEICAAFGWNGDVLQARDRAREAANGQDVAYFVPREGSMLWVDVLAIPVDAPHVDNAHRFIDYILRPAVAASISNAVNYASANRAAEPLVEVRLRQDPGVYPDPAARARLFAVTATTPDYERLRTRAWTRIKTGH